jgi:hypothetical protein
MKTFITALMLFLALASGISMIALAFRGDFRELAADRWRPDTVGTVSAEFGMRS